MPSPLIEAARAAFDHAGWQYREVPDRGVLESGFEAHHGRIHVIVQGFADVKAVCITAEGRSLDPARLPGEPALRSKAAELLMRTNLSLTVGAFELDWDTGRIYFRHTNVFPDPASAPPVITALVHAAIAEADRMTALVGTLAATPPPDVALLDVTALLRRDDLIPPTPPS